jgi:hypothetical protein
MAVGLVSGLMGLAGAGMQIGGALRARDEIMENLKSAETRMQMDKDTIRNTQFENRFADLENTLEDLTIDRTSYDAQKQDVDRDAANVLDALVQTGVGGTGAAQSLLATIGKQKRGIEGEAQKRQEALNQMAAMQQERLDFKEATAADDLQLRNFSKAQQMFNMSSADLVAARDAAAQNTAALTGGIGSAISAMGSFGFGKMGGGAGGGGSKVGKLLGSIFPS